MANINARSGMVLDSWNRSVAPPTAQQMAATNYVLGLMRPSPLIPGQKFLQLNLADPLQYQFFMDRFGNIAGHPMGSNFPSRTELIQFMAQQGARGAANQPVMLNSLATASATYLPVALISMFDYDAGDPNNVTAGGLISIPNGATLIDSVMQIYQDNQLIAQGTGTGYGQFTVSANATGTQVTAGAELTAVLTGHYSSNSQGATAVPFTVSQNLSPVPLLTIAVTNPVHKVTTAPNPYTVALGRTPSPPAPADTDYSYNKTTSPPYNFDLEIAVSGTATPQKPTDQFNTAVAVTGSLVLIKQSGATSGGGVTVTYPGGINASCQVAPAQLSWNFNPADFNQNPPWTSGDVILLNLNLIAAMNGTTPVTVTVTSDQSGNLTAQQPDNTSFIDALQFYWGCLAAETEVRLADGSVKAVGNLKKGDRVLSTGGRTLTVFGLKTGRESKPMIEIASDGGHVVLVTDGHAIVTENGLKAARDVVVGDRLATSAGACAVQSVRSVSYDGAVFNPTLVDDDGTFPEQAAFLAGGIYVGDDRMQTKVEQAEVAKLASEAHRDLLQSLKGWELDMENHRRALAGEPLLSVWDAH